jgi:hypothetical protein
VTELVGKFQVRSLVMFQKSTRRVIFGFTTTEVYPRLLTPGVPQRGMLARLAAHINQGQMAVAGLGGGGEGAIVIDDNCTVSMFHEYGAAPHLLTRKSRSCDFWSGTVMTTRPTSMDI